MLAAEGDVAEAVGAALRCSSCLHFLLLSIRKAASHESVIPI